MKSSPTGYWATNIRFLRNRKRLNQDDLATQLGISRSKLNAHENGQTVNPVVEDLISFSAYFKLSIDSLIKVDLSKLSELKLRELEAGNDVYITGSKIRVLATAVDSANEDRIEFVPQKAKAGYLAGYGDPEYISKLPVFSLPHLPRDRKFRMFPTSGDSMHPIPQNSLVIANYVEDWTTLKPETPCIVITKEEGIVFKLVTSQVKKNRTLLLQSLNNIYVPYEVEVGNVVEVWQFMNYISDTIPQPEIPVAEMGRTLHEIRSDLKKLMSANAKQ